MEAIPTRPDTFFRVGPARLAEHSSFAIKRGHIDGRIDVNYWWLTPSVDQRLENSRFDVTPLGSLLSLVQYGCSSLAKEDVPGIPILRMNNLKDDGWNFSNLKFIELSERELATYRLLPSDILINRTNSKELVGKCAVFQEPGDWVFASYLIRIRTNQDRLLPQFAADFLGTDVARLQINRVSRQIIGMTNINAEEIRDLQIPLPSTEEQGALVSAMDTARSQRLEKLTKAEDLLLSLDEYVLEALKVAASLDDRRRVFAVQQGDSRREGRLNPDYYHPERMSALASLNDISGELVVEPLVNVANFVREQLATPGANYVGLAHIQSQTGVLNPNPPPSQKKTPRWRRPGSQL